MPKLPIRLSFLGRSESGGAVSSVKYLFQFFYPVDLAVFYPTPEGGYRWPGVAGATVLLAAITTAAIVWRRKCPYLLVGWLWFVGMMFPVLGLVSVSNHAMADRYMYLRSIGLMLELSGAARLASLSVTGPSRWERPRRLSLGCWRAWHIGKLRFGATI